MFTSLPEEPGIQGGEAEANTALERLRFLVLGKRGECTSGEVGESNQSTEQDGKSFKTSGSVR